jgi:hypothetical protein
LDGAPSSTQDDDADTVLKEFKVFLSSRHSLQDAEAWWHARLLPSFNEAASVNQKLLRSESAHRQKRRRLSDIGSDTKSEEPDRTTIPPLKQDTRTETPTTTSCVEESVSIWNQAARTKRMCSSRDLEMTHCLLLHWCLQPVWLPAA